MLFTENYHPELSPITYIENSSCPNCWGYSRWDGKDCTTFTSIDKGSNLDIFSNNGFIRRFMKKHIG